MPISIHIHPSLGHQRASTVWHDVKCMNSHEFPWIPMNSQHPNGIQRWQPVANTRSNDDPTGSKLVDLRSSLNWLAFEILFSLSRKAFSILATCVDQKLIKNRWKQNGMPQVPKPAKNGCLLMATDIPNMKLSTARNLQPLKSCLKMMVKDKDLWNSQFSE